MKPFAPKGAWSLKRGLGPFHPSSDFCHHCRQEIGPGDKGARKGELLLCLVCHTRFFPSYRN